MGGTSHLLGKVGLGGGWGVSESGWRPGKDGLAEHWGEREVVMKNNYTPSTKKKGCLIDLGAPTKIGVRALGNGRPGVGGEEDGYAMVE